MNKRRIEACVWILVYGGLLTVSVAVFVLRAGGDTVGWPLLALGVLLTVAGAVLVVVRARMEPPPPAGPARPARPPRS